MEAFFHVAGQEHTAYIGRLKSYTTAKEILTRQSNYAVSEREDRVTDLTTLTRITGCTGMYWAANGLYLAPMGCTGLY